MIDTKSYTNLHNLTSALLSHWPEHTVFIEKSLAGRSTDVLEVSEELSKAIFKLSEDIAGGIGAIITDYRFLCEDIVLPEEIYFRRNGKYRLTTFDEANAECYANHAFMDRYMNGLLLSDVMWSNHAHGFGYFVNSYLPRLPEMAHHLEIGPGHGLFLYFAQLSDKVGKLTGWDVSPTSIAKTTHALKNLGAVKAADLVLQNLYDAAGDEQFDSIILSEVLEHLEDPEVALQSVADRLAPNGLLWINVPANSPAPDHIFLVDSVEHAARLVEATGLKVIEAVGFPMTGTTLERAKKHKLAITCSVIGQRI